MEKVLGIGGFFFRANDPDGLNKWYEEHLGIDLVPTSEGAESWRQQAGTTVFCAFAKDTDYFGKPSQMWMLNFRVKNLDAMVAQLRAKGIEVDFDPEEASYGRFARLNDPEGNPIELWEETVA